MDRKTELAEQEGTRWAEFEAALQAIPRERWDEPGAVPGWTLKAVVRHVAGWLEDLVAHLAEMRAGTFVDPNESTDVIDARNSGFAEQSVTMSPDEVWDGLLSARAAALAGWDQLAAIDDAAVEWFVGETTEHYEEHLPDVRRAAGD
jgi:Mycothiol maleylpyruvate isomerase N-terminal domain